MAIYPSGIPTNTDYPNRTDDVSWIYAARYNEIKNEVIAICAELGISPSGASATVVARLALLALKASPTFTGEATIPTINLTGGQIKFPATAVPSADPNTIDDYEKGTFTVSFVCGTSGTITLEGTEETAAYIKIGNQIALTGSLGAASVSSPVGSLSLTTLPFTAGNGSQFNAGMSCIPYNLNATAATSITSDILNLGTAIRIFHFAAGVRGDAAADIKAGSKLYLGGIYFSG